MSESLVAEQSHIDVGQRLRVIRQARRLTLRDVAERSGVSESFLSQVERGRTSASIASLQRIAGALGLAVSDLFAPNGGDQPRVLRREHRHPIAFGTRGRKVLLTPKPLQMLEVVVAEFDSGGSTGDEAYSHGDSEELFLVVAGRVLLELDGETFQLGAGDCVQYRSSTPHRVTNESDERAEVMFIVSPPSF